MDPKILIILIHFAALTSCSDTSCYYRLMNTKINGYMCSLKSENSNLVTEINGEHLKDYTDDDVELLYSRNVTFSTFTSAFCEKFKNINRIKMEQVSKVTAINSDALKNCKNLVEFRLIEGKLTELPENLFTENLKLQELSFELNQLTTLPENLFSNLNDLKILELNENKINFLPANIFKSLTSLQRLSLSRNKLNFLNPTWFKNLHSLQEFAMSYSRISDIPKNTFKNCHNLKFVWLSGNELTVIHSDSFGYMPNFTDFYISDNKINAIDSKLIDQSKLKVVYMEGNECSQTVDEYVKKDDLKRELQKCFENYQPRLE